MTNERLLRNWTRVLPVSRSSTCSHEASKCSLGDPGRGLRYGAWRLVRGFQDTVAGGDGGTHGGARAVPDPRSSGVARAELGCRDARHGPFRAATADFDRALRGQGRHRTDRHAATAKYGISMILFMPRSSGRTLSQRSAAM